MIIFQDHSLETEKDIPGQETGKILGEYLYLKRQKGIYNGELSRVNTPRKGRPATYSEKETCLKFGQAE